MPGYILVERNNILPYKEKGFKDSYNKICILDFLSELSQEVFPFPKLYEAQVTGLEDALFWAKDNDRDIAFEIKNRLRQMASELERKVIIVHVVLQCKIVKGVTMWLEYRGKKLPIDLIFGNPVRQTDKSGNNFYQVSFNLTSGG